MRFRGDPIPDLRVGDVLHLDQHAVQVVETTPRNGMASVAITMGDHMFQVIGRHLADGVDPIMARAARRQIRYQIECLSCEVLVHEATPTPLSTAQEHLRRVDAWHADGR
jgi:hypothetical protein